MSSQELLILSKNEEEALVALKENVKNWLQRQLGNGLLYSNDRPFLSNQSAVFKKFKIDADKQRPLLVQAIKEEVLEL